ncbi:hypothetical protein ACPCAC_09545 [Streptomyces lavendulocolor]
MLSGEKATREEAEAAEAAMGPGAGASGPTPDGVPDVDRPL